MGNLSLGTLKSASPNDFGYKFPSSIASFPSRPHNVFRVLTQGKQHLSFRRMHMSEVWAPMIDALSTDGKGKDLFGDPSLNLPNYVYLI